MSADIRSSHLEVQHGDRPPSHVLLDGATLRIGRAQDNQLQVPDAHVSKRHAEIRKEIDDYVVVDVGSLAGVLVNGAKVDRAVLTDGDVIELGDTSPVRLTFRAQQQPEHRLDMTTFAALPAGPEQGSLTRLARFFEFSHKLGGGFSLAEVLRDVVDLAMDVTKAERGMLMLRRADGSIDMQVARAAGGRALPEGGVQVSETIVQKAFASPKPIVIEDVRNDANLALAESIMSLELRSAVTLPLVRHVVATKGGTAITEVFGLVYLDSRRRRGGFDGFDRDILGRLAGDASAVIENARLVREAEDQRRIAQEVATAREVQAALMPEQFRSSAAFEIAGTCVPCHELGGDYVDQFDLGGGRIALVVADVAGKGIGASLLAATLQGALASQIDDGGLSLGDLVARVNRVHCRVAPVGKFITMVVAALSPAGTVELVNAGHCAALHCHDGGTEAVTTGGMALGLDADAEYHAVELRLQPGDALVLYSDGVIECEDQDRQLFGEERLVEALAGQRNATAPQVLDHIIAEVARFRRGAPVSDDVSVLVARRT